MKKEKSPSANTCHSDAHFSSDLISGLKRNQFKLLIYIFFPFWPEVSSQSGGKAFKCSYCSRSYKQQSTLEDHQERCHSYLKSRQAAVVRQAAPGNTGARHCRLVGGEHLCWWLFLAGVQNMDGRNQSNEKVQQVDRLVMTIAKRKRTMPQKFLG